MNASHVFASVAVLSLFTGAIAVPDTARRELLQSFPESPSVVRTAAELQLATTRLLPNETITIDTDEPLTLLSPIALTVPGVTLRGRSANFATLTCPSETQSAIIIVGVDVQLESLRFRGCGLASAVRIEPAVTSALFPARVSFSDVHFIGNGLDDAAVNGSAIHVSHCPLHTCQRPQILIQDCTFVQNQAQMGGCIFVLDGEVTIRNSVFVNNLAALLGGAIALASAKSSLVVRRSTFNRNRVTWSAIDKTGSIERFYGKGGAISALHPRRLALYRTSFSRNTACTGGGALDVRMMAVEATGNDSTLFRIHDSAFHDNVAYCLDEADLEEIEILDRNYYIGGALSFESTEHRDLDWMITDSIFERNRGRYGGALYLRGSPEVPLMIYGTRFDDNVALSGGGAVSVRSSRVRMRRSLIRRNQALWGGGIMIWSGGQLETTIDPNHPNLDTLIENNTAIYGGGLHHIIGGKMNLTALTLRGNTAFRYGGGMRSFATQSDFSLAGVTIEQNRAMTGGGLAFFAAPQYVFTSHRGRPTLITNNSASVGGGLYFDTGHYLPVLIQMKDVVVTHNRASPLQPDVAEMVLLGEGYRPWPTAPAIPPFFFMEFFDDRSIVEVLAAVPDGQGGGLCMTFANLQFFSVAQITFENVLMERNEAVVGGGASLHFSDLFWNKGDRVQCFPAAFGFDFCQRVYFSNVTIQHNRAEYAGGFFVSNPDDIYLTCDIDAPDLDHSFDKVYRRQATAQGDLDPREDLRCMTVQNNRISDGADVEGANVGTIAASLFIEGLGSGHLQEVASGQNLVLSCLDSANASCVREMVVSVRDAFNQTISRGIEDAELSLSLLSTGIGGEVKYTTKNGTVAINNTQARGIGIDSRLVIQSDRDPSIQARTDFSTRQCLPGEFGGVDICHECSVDVYSFNSTLGQCQPCEDHAVCRGRAALVPATGYWHSTPFSPQFQRCIAEEGCSFENREALLSAFYDNTTRVQQDLDALNAFIGGQGTQPEFPDYNQCAEGYEGILCGSCQVGYGQGSAGACEKCPAKGAKTGLLLFVIYFWTFVMIGANCLVTLVSARARVQLVKYETKQQATLNRPRALLRAGGHIQDQTTVRTRLSRHNTLSRGISSISDEQTKLVLTQQLVATVQLTETLKILINYLQITSSAMRLPVDWKSGLNGLFSLQGKISVKEGPLKVCCLAAFVGITSEAVSIPFECNIEGAHGWTPSIKAIWMRLFTPMLALWTLVLLYTVLWIIGRFLTGRHADRSRRLSVSHLITGVIVIFIVSVYFSYIDNIRELLRIVNCVRVESSSVKAADHPYAIYAIEEGDKIWAEDTSQICYQGGHLPTGIVGIIGLCMALVAIVFIIVWLPLNRVHVTKTQFVARYWFIYQAYKKQWYTLPWEAVILIRKSLIAAVVVFSFQLGPNLQATLCVGTLILAHILHVTLLPFKVPDNHSYVPDYVGGTFKALHMPKLAAHWVKLNNALSLNSLESASLVSSIIVFFTAILLIDAKASELGRQSVSALAFAVNFIFLVYMLYRLYCGLHVLLDLKLEVMNPHLMATRENGLGFLQFMVKAAHVSRGALHRYLEERQANETEAVQPTEEIDEHV